MESVYYQVSQKLYVQKLLTVLRHRLLLEHLVLILLEDSVYHSFVNQIKSSLSGAFYFFFHIYHPTATTITPSKI